MVSTMVRTASSVVAYLICAALLVAGCGSGSGGGGNPPPPAAGYHVSPTGDDANPGTAAQPWASIQHAADTAGPGDLVTIHAGRYDEDVVLGRSGTVAAENPLFHRSGVGRSHAFAEANTVGVTGSLGKPWVRGATPRVICR